MPIIATAIFDLNVCPEILPLPYTHTAYVQKKLLAHSLEKTFIVGDGFKHWKKACGKEGSLSKHEKSDCHIESVSKFNQKENILAKISNEYLENQVENRKCLIIIIEEIQYLVRQGLALRGDQTVEENAAEFNSNFHQALLKEGRRNPMFAKWVEKKTHKYTSPIVQNELIEMMALEVLRSVVKNIQFANFFSIMADESPDISNIEQMSFGVRYVKDYKACECFIGLHELENTKAEHLVDTMKRILTACNFDFSKIRGQCYDGASAMSGAKSGVKTRILSENPKALFIHCYNHALNLAVMDTLNKIILFKDAMSYSEELIKLFKKSPKRDTLFKKLKLEACDESPGLKDMATTRWTVKGDCLSRIINNYKLVYLDLEESLYEETRVEMKSRLNGVMFQMRNFNYFFGICLAKEILLVTDNLAVSLQKKDLSALEGHELYKVTAEALKGMKTEDFEKFWENTVKKAGELKVKEPELKRKIKKPSRYFVSSQKEDENVPETPKEQFKKIFYEAFDLVLECLKSRFEQESLKMYQNLQELLLLAAKKEDYSEVLDEILDFYEGDFDDENLRTQIKVYQNLFPSNENVSYGDIIPFFMQLKPEIRDLISEVCKVLELIIVLPASNAHLERSFSKMRLIKTRLRSTMSAKRLNHFMVIGHYKDLVDNLDLGKIADEFIEGRKTREKVLGKVINQ